MFSIYFSVVVSLTTEECVEILGSERGYLLRNYKFAMEQALTRARLLETEEMIVLQAFVIYLTGLRCHCSMRLMWSLTALAVRLAQNAGLHRDGTHFNLSPFTMEMRRRLWWSICVLDSRASEDSGYDAAIPLDGVDTQIPLNVDDSELLPNMTELPKPTIGLTSMTFSVVRFEATRTFRRLQYASAGTIGKCGKLHAAKNLAEKSEMIANYQGCLQDIFLKHRDPSDPFCWYIATICAIVITKMWLLMYHPYLRKESCAGLSQETRNTLFIGSISMIESWLQLNTEVRTRKWRWLCETYIQWYAITFILTELCVRTQGELVERAWKAIYAALKLGCRTSPGSCRINEAEFGEQLHLDGTNDNAYRPLNRLLKKARAARDPSMLISDDIESTFSNPGVGFTFEAESLNFHELGFNALFPDNHDISCPLNTQPNHSYQEWNYNHANFDSLHPIGEEQPLNWTNWQYIPEYGANR